VSPFAYWFLIRAGSRNSSLTSHGFEQAKRLGTHLHLRSIELTHVFASPLERANVTAEQIVAAQTGGHNVTFVSAPELQEQDFGIYEGARYGQTLVSVHDQATVETPHQLRVRAKSFINTHLVPLLDTQPTASLPTGNLSSTPTTNRNTRPVVAIVSHGNMLHVLWPQILARIKPTNVTCSQEMLIDSGSIDHAMLGQWTNTGVLEATITTVTPTKPVSTIPATESQSVETQDVVLAAVNQDPAATQTVPRTVEILAINDTTHLRGLHRTRGGVGSSKYDSRQTSLESFFKRR
jgi:broad specificity phosphatase PhoE